MNASLLKNNDLQNIVVKSLIESAKCLDNSDICTTKNNWLNNIVYHKSTITITADIWKPLSTYIIKDRPLTYSEAVRFVICMGLQLNALAKANYGLAQINPEDIMVINHDWYLLTNFDNISSLKKEQIHITQPFNTNNFSAPELENINTLPAEIHHTSSYYSIAMICVYSLGLSYQDEDLNKLLPSPLYFFLQRCFATNPSDRAYLLI